MLVGARGAREAAVSIAAAFERAQDFIYLETPALDHREHGPDDDRLNLTGRLIDRLDERRGLRVVLCVPARLGPGTPKKLQAVRDAELLDAIRDLRAAGGDRLAVLSPGAGAGRALRFATTTVVVDDTYALTGTTHLWRRGLTFDSSLAASVFDERLTDGRPQEIFAFRRPLVADRLGLAPTRVPDDPEELVRALQALDETAPRTASARAPASAARPYRCWRRTRRRASSTWTPGTPTAPAAISTSPSCWAPSRSRAPTTPPSMIEAVTFAGPCRGLR